MLCMLLPSCVTLGKSLYLSGPYSHQTGWHFLDFILDAKVRGLPRDLSPPLLCPILTLLLTLLQAHCPPYCSSNMSHTILPQCLYTYSTHCLSLSLEG